LLKNVSPRGVRAYGFFNNTSAGQTAKEAVMHGDLTSLSVFANHLKQRSGDVLHGEIKEVSLVQAGANPGALIDVIISHSDEEGYDEETAFITWGEDETIETEETAEAEIEHADEESGGGKSAQEIFDSMTPEQQNCCFFMMEKAVEMSKSEDGNKDEVKHSDDDDEDAEDNDISEEIDEAEEPENNNEEENVEMKHNAFENANTAMTEQEALCHSFIEELDFNELVKSSKSSGKTFGQTFLAHADEYGIKDIDFLNPEPKEIYDRPPFIQNQPTSWVSVVMSKVHNTPFANVRMTFADITEDEARAKGYIKGKYKKEEVFKLLRRSVTPTTIYKKQKFDRDDLIDADFDVIPWVKQEMNIKFDEEKARAYLFGDGRSASDEDKIKEDCIIPIVKDEDLFTIKKVVTPESGESTEHAIIKEAVLAQDDYQGSGNTIAFIEAKQVSKMLLMEDQFGHRLYKNIADLASAMGVGQVVKVPAGICPQYFYALIVDLADYNVGMKNAGKTNFFDDFDIDYNQQKYLMETRQSGALTKPYSAIVLTSQ
jgi:hypothetical protein